MMIAVFRISIQSIRKEAIIIEATIATLMLYQVFCGCLEEGEAIIYILWLLSFYTGVSMLKVRGRKENNDYVNDIHHCHASFWRMCNTASG